MRNYTILTLLQEFKVYLFGQEQVVYTKYMQAISLVSLHIERITETPPTKKIMNSMKTCPSVTFYFMKNSFSDISSKWILPNMIRAVPAPIILGNKIHFLLISENELFMK